MATAYDVTIPPLNAEGVAEYRVQDEAWERAALRMEPTGRFDRLFGPLPFGVEERSLVPSLPWFAAGRTLVSHTFVEEGEQRRQAEVQCD